MKRLVVYQSSTGFTKQYADWMAKELGCEAKPIKKVTISEVKEQDVIVFGGWIFGSMVMGLNKIRKMSPSKLVVFGVGLTQAGEEVETLIRNQNHLEATPFFYLQGGFRPEKLGFLKRMMLSLVRKSVAKKQEKTEQDIFMEEALSKPGDYTDVSFIKPLVEFIAEI